MRFQGDEDSDQSISDEEDFNVDLRDNCVSLGGPSEKEEVVQLQSRLDILKGSKAQIWFLTYRYSWRNLWKDCWQFITKEANKCLCGRRG